MKKINLFDKFNQIHEHWSPRIVGELNGQYVKLAKLKGDFLWHSHPEEDEYFQVIQGNLTIHFRDESIALEAGECLIVPRGTEHKPEAATEAWVLLFEPIATRHTGDVESEKTVQVEDQPWL